MLGGDFEMSLSQRIAPHLPFLRRFSRALTGDQQVGDAYVAALLELIIADPSTVREAGDLKTELYRHYCKVWESVSLNLRSRSERQNWEVSAQEHLSSLSPKAREAFLLMALEGFGQDQVAEILSLDLVKIAELITEASATISQQVTTDVLIIEDEPIIALELEDIVGSLGHRIIGVARTETQALEVANGKQPKLILADIQLADGSSGLDAVAKLLKRFEAPVIFITAFPERLLTGQRPEPAFLLTKPFVPDMVKAVISQALFFDTKARMAA
jgi:CheY-like chemotaxis protein/DNA-directed RNA polymerase specialized sigma24 family protein